MSLIEAVILGVVQGLTEFIPISSSAHLVLVPWLLRWDKQSSLAFDTILHLGTLVGVLGYFAPEIWQLLTAWLVSLRHPARLTAQARTAWLLLLATIPAAAAGLLLEDWFAAMFAAPAAVGAFLLATALLLTAADGWGYKRTPGYPTRWWQALIIGVAQAAAIAPGISRSGATITAGMLLGLSRTAAARFSFLLSVPIILGAGASQSLRLWRDGQSAEQWGVLAVGFLTAAVVGYLCIRWLLGYLSGHSLRAFAGYCALLGAFTLLASALPR